jgi:hypothetical protein
LSQSIKIRVFQSDDFKEVIDFISDIIVNEFKFKLELDTLDSDIIAIDETYNKSNRACFWVAQTIDYDDHFHQTAKNSRHSSCKKFETF